MINKPLSALPSSVLPPNVRRQIAGEGNLSLTNIKSLPINGEGNVRPLLTPKLMEQSLELKALQKRFRELAADDLLYVQFGKFFFKQLQAKGLLQSNILE
ncbi:MAG: hypothetical protein ABIH69_01945 [bacterium]